MTLVTERKKSALIDKLATLIKGRVAKGQSRNAENFLRQLYGNVAAHDLAGAKPVDLAGAAASIFEFGQKRKAGQSKVRVINPVAGDDGWGSQNTIVEVVNDDMPFLVDTITSELNRQGHTVHLVVHPIIRVTRTPAGAMKTVVPAEGRDDLATSESYMHVQIDEQASPASIKKIEKGLRGVLADASAAVADWLPMRNKVTGVISDLSNRQPPNIPAEEIAEAIAFLQWIDDHNFTFLGYREYQTVGTGAKARMVPVKGAGLGVLRDPDIHVFEGVRSLAKLPKEVRAYLMRPRLLIINKANMKSTVHRAVHLDAIGLKQFDSKGKVVRELLFVGLFTSAAYNRIPADIPLLRRKVATTIQRSGFAPHSHDGKALQNILEKFPRDELFQISGDKLAEISQGILHLQERQRVALFCRPDAFQRFVSCYVYAPRERYSTDLRKIFQHILEDAFEGPVTAFDTQIGKESAHAQVFFTVKTTPGEVPAYNLKEIEAELAEAARTWGDRLLDALSEKMSAAAAIELSRKYAEAFPASYTEAFRPDRAVEDIVRIEKALETGALQLHLYRPDGADGSEVRLKLYHPGVAIPLSDVLPMLENMGLKVMSEEPHHIDLGKPGGVQIHDFGMVLRDGRSVNPDDLREVFQEAFLRLWSGDMENDGFNGLVLSAGLPWRDVVVLRACCKYLRQAGIPFSQSYMEETLAANLEIAGLLVHLFHARFDPAAKDRKAAANRAARKISAHLEQVASLDQDRIIRRYENLIQNMLRTNFYQAADNGDPKQYVSFKIQSREITDLPLPRPFREIFVYSPRVEGVHLRFGKVARGGLRWSDRREDFRTEVLGLVKAQQVKNAVIVPVGSKGGFVMKKPPQEGGREAFMAEGIASYRTFISGLLDITDNLKGDKVIPPKSVVRWDEDDPYLVVAADKGTATFSDIANGIAQDYGFWLDDAFASGGSAGYDHKVMGITARGAWEAVKRHFREIGKDIQNQDFTVVGVGDMSGDVFGNGMLLSRHIKLLAAFNHLHIFIDPDPDPEKSFKERERMFKLPRSTWDDYNKKLISKGGGVFDRAAKAVKLTPEIKALTGLAADSVPPNDLLKALLTADVELLWFGGIGTYVKAKTETHADAGDRANDALRINGSQVGAKVVGEGANLGMTQRGRIEIAMAGGRLNTDAVDNSAGVNSSDQEVNIKILTGMVEASGKLKRAERNKLLARMTNEVAELVLENNYLQTQSITVTQSAGARLLDRQAQFMKELERSGDLNREIEFLPDDETLEQRKAAGLGMTRPELSVLLAYSKIVLYDDLVASDLPDDSFMSKELTEYFPTPLREKYKTQIGNHRLRREIIGTAITNEIVNRAGFTFVHELQERSGLEACDVVRGYVITREIFQLQKLWKDIEELDNKASAQLQSQMLIELGRILTRSTIWFLRHGDRPLNISESIAVYGKDVARLQADLGKILTPDNLQLQSERAAILMEQGAPQSLAEAVVSLRAMVPACDIVRVARGSNTPILPAAQMYADVGDRFGFDQLRRAAGQLPIDSHWDKQAVEAIIDDLYGMQYDLTQKLLSTGKRGKAAADAVERWSKGREALLQRISQILEELSSGGTPELSVLAVANRQMRSLVTS